MLEGNENISQIQPSRSHLDKYRKWLSSMANEISIGQYRGLI